MLRSVFSGRTFRLLIMGAALFALSGWPAYADAGGHYPYHNPGYGANDRDGSSWQAYRGCWGPRVYPPPQGWLPTITYAESEAVAARNAGSQPDQFGHYAQPYNGATPTPCLYMNPNDANQVFNTTTGTIQDGTGVVVPASIAAPKR